MTEGKNGRGSMEHAVARAHRELDALFDETRAALRAGERAVGVESRDCLCEALETHFAQEDDLYFPAISSLRPEARASVKGFAEDHERLRSLSRELRACMEKESREEVEAGLAEFAAFFAEHEAREEEFLHSLDRDLARAPH